MTIDTSPTTWQAVSAAKLAARDALIPEAWRLTKLPDVKNVTDIPRTCGILTATEIEITETPATTLVQRMLARELTSVAVTTAFCKRAAIACQVTNCLSEIFFEDALRDAAAIDAAYARDSTPAGPLHGLPISLKDNMSIKGYDSAIGFVNSANQPAAADCYLATVFKQAGGVLFCKTTVPTAMMLAETYSNLMGYTPCPFNTDMLAGGSSGGEGVLLAMRGSPLGNGTDIGGSIRVPAAINGIYGLKPSAGRWSLRGMKSGMAGQEAVRGVLGPMAHDLDAIELWCRVVLAAKPWDVDPMCYNLPWKEVELPGKLCFGIMYDDIVAPTPAVARALRETAAALTAAGHSVLEFPAYNPADASQILMGLLGGDGGKAIGSLLQGETDELTEPWPVGMKKWEAVSASDTPPPSATDLWALQARKQVHNTAILDQWMATAQHTGTGRPVDGVISCVYAYPTAPRYAQEYLISTGMWNLADLTSLAFPAGFVKRTDVKSGSEPMRNEQEKRVWDNYDAEALEGCPVGLQVASPKHQEELAIKLGRVITTARENHVAK